LVIFQNTVQGHLPIPLLCYDLTSIAECSLTIQVIVRIANKQLSTCDGQSVQNPVSIHRRFANAAITNNYFFTLLSFK